MYSYFSTRTRTKAATNVPFTNVGDIPRTSTAIKQAQRDTGVSEKGQSMAISFSEPGTHYCICAPHPWMSREVIVE